MPEKKKPHILWFIDTETSGLDPKRHCLLSLAIIPYYYLISLGKVHDLKFIRASSLHLKFSHKEFVAQPTALRMNEYLNWDIMIDPLEAGDAFGKWVNNIYGKVSVTRLYRENYIHPCGWIPTFDVGFFNQFLSWIMPRAVATEVFKKRSFFNYKAIDVYSVYTATIKEGLLGDSLSDAFINVFRGARHLQFHDALDDATAAMWLYHDIVEHVKK